MSDFILTILSLVFIGISVILLINNVKKRNEKRKISEYIDEGHIKDEENTEKDYMSIGMSLGMCFGVAIGSLLTNIFGINSIFYGVCLGMIGGMIIGTTIKKK